MIAQVVHAARRFATGPGTVAPGVCALGILALLPLGLEGQQTGRAAMVPAPLGTALGEAEGAAVVRRSGPGPFVTRQLTFPRVERAFARRSDRVAASFEERGLGEPAEVFFRVFKRERELEVWARDAGDARFTLVRAYPVCAVSGRLGPKRREGDLQVPEGFYTLDLFNPDSEYHLSLRVDYPNAVDSVRATRAGHSLGGDIFIHGGCATVGCVPVTDEWIEDLYLIALQARDAGQREIPVHIFPTHLTDEGLGWLARTYGREFVDYDFWANLQEGYLAFERTRRLPAIAHRHGRYTFFSSSALSTLPQTATHAFALIH